MERGAVGSGAGTPGPGRSGPSDGACRGRPSRGCCAARGAGASCPGDPRRASGAPQPRLRSLQHLHPRRSGRGRRSATPAASSTRESACPRARASLERTSAARRPGMRVLGLPAPCLHPSPRPAEEHPKKRTSIAPRPFQQAPTTSPLYSRARIHHAGARRRRVHPGGGLENAPAAQAKSSTNRPVAPCSSSQPASSGRSARTSALVPGRRMVWPASPLRDQPRQHAASRAASDADRPIQPERNRTRAPRVGVLKKE